MNNPYIKSPLFVSQLNPESGIIISTHFFLGIVPKTVLNAANNVIFNASNPQLLKWEKKDAIILENFYGKHWKKLLTPKPPLINENISNNKNMPMFFSYTGGNGDNIDDDNIENNNDLEFFEKNDLDYFDNSNNDLTPDEEIDIKLFDNNENNILFDYKLSINKQISAPKYLPISVYPEDTVYDLRLKIFIATKIEFYRQHIFYYINDEGPSISYQFNIDNIPIYVNYKDLYRKDNTLCGIHIDNVLDQRKDGIEVKALDTFIQLQINDDIRINAVYLIDLYTVFQPIDYLQRPIDNLPQILKDKYEFSFLYHGAIIKYWPQLTMEIANIALSNPKNMNKYLSLAHNFKHINEKINIEQLVANDAINWNNKTKLKNNIAITGTTIKIFSKSANTRCLIRNVFDCIETNNTIILVNSKFDIESALLSESGVELVSMNERQGEFISITGIKQYATSQDPKYAAITEWFINNKTETNTIIIAILRNNIKESIASPFIYLTLYSNGQYNISGEWLEDNKVYFDTITKELCKIVKPLLEKINLMGVAAFPSGGEFNIIDESDNIVLGNITGSIFYPKYFSEPLFKELKKKLKQLEKASIIKFKNNQNPEIIAFAFLKGIVSYNLKLAERAENSNYNENVSNQYTWLSNSLVSNRWNTSFSGRLVKIHHRATDIKLEIINVDNINEFDLIKKYIFSFLDNVYNELSKNEKIVDINNVKSKKKLKKLQENDPNLFDLKKYNPKNKVYSVLCQSDRQPFSYNEQEMKQLSNKQKTKLIKYWNFTENIPAYYECPNAKFPHLSFRPDKHPLGYCLPCCNMALPPPNSKSADIYNQCLTHKKGNIKKLEEVSKHILTYGKLIQVGRISEIGKEISSGLFLGLFKNNNNMYIIGVDQYVPSIQNAGLTYSIIYLVKEKNKNIEQTIRYMANFVKNMTDNFYQLGNGSGMLYTSSNDLSDDIINIFIEKREMSSLLDKSGQIINIWELILLDLIQIIYKLNIVIFIEDGDGSFFVEYMVNFISENDTIFLLKNSNGIYPIIMTDIKIYLKNMSNFLPTEDICVRQFNKIAHNKIYTIIEKIFNSSSEKDIDILPIMRIESIVKKSKDYKITSLFINFNNYCYGVLISNLKNKEEFYFPIQYSYYLSYTKYNLLYYPITEKQIPSLQTLKQFIYNNAFKINIEFNLINSDNKYIGFKDKNLCYFFKENDKGYEEEQQNKEEHKCRNIIFPYSIIDINNEIVKHIRNNDKNDNFINKKYINAIMQNRYYKYFIAEFSSILRNDKNEPMRKKIKSLLLETKFDETNSLTSLRINLIKLLENHPSDLIILKEIISKSFMAAINNQLDNIINYIDSTLFDFDKQLLYNLKKLEYDELIKKIKNIMANHIKEQDSDESNIDKISNIYISCGEKSIINKVQCHGSKLLLPKSIIEDFYHILAMDIKNPTKTKLFTSLSAGIFDSMDFIKRDNEILEIYIEN
jgi:hypothetical protein